MKGPELLSYAYDLWYGGKLKKLISICIHVNPRTKVEVIQISTMHGWQHEEVGPSTAKCLFN